MVALPFLLAGASTGGLINDLFVGMAVAALSLPRGRISESFGSWDRFVP